MEATEEFSSQTIKEEPSSPIAFKETSIDKDNLSYKVESEKEVKANDGEFPCQTDAPSFGEDIKTEELDILSNSDDERKYNKRLEPGPLALKKETIFSEGPKTEDDNSRVPHFIPHKDINNSIFYEVPKLPGNEKLPDKNGRGNKMLFNKLYAKSFVLLGKRIDQDQMNLKINSQSTSSNFNDVCTNNHTEAGEQSACIVKLNAKLSFMRSARVECKSCNKSFTSKYNLNQHVRSHTGEKSYSCDHCQKLFSHKCNLSRHLSTHTDEKPYSCNHCMKSFSLKNALRLHIRSHTGERPYSCNHCLKSFSRLSTLKQHLFTHTGLKPYSCNHCLKSFSRLSTLKQHLFTHTGLKPYSCDKCLKSFSVKNDLSRHLRTHTAEKPYSCNHCMKSFAQQRYLKQHLKTHTSKNP